MNGCLNICPIFLSVFLIDRKCQKVLGKNMDLWENEVYRFKTIGQLKVSLQNLYFFYNYLPPFRTCIVNSSIILMRMLIIIKNNCY